MLPVHVWEWFNPGEQEAAGERVITTLTLHIPARIGKRGIEEGAIYEDVGCIHAYLFVGWTACKRQALKDFCFFMNNPKPKNTKVIKENLCAPFSPFCVFFHDYVNFFYCQTRQAI